MVMVQPASTGECGWFVFAAKVVELGSIVWFEIKQSMMRKGNARDGDVDD